MNKYDLGDDLSASQRRERLKYLAVCYLTDENLKVWHEEELWCDELNCGPSETYSYLRMNYLGMLYEQEED